MFLPEDIFNALSGYIVDYFALSVTGYLRIGEGGNGRLC